MNPWHKVRISKKLLAALPKDVAEQLVSLQYNGFDPEPGRSARFSSVTFTHEAAPYRHYFAEGDSYTFLYSGRTLSMQMSTNENHHTGMTRDEIGAEQLMPAGTVIFVTYYTYDARTPYACRVICVGEAAITADGTVRPEFDAARQALALPAPQEVV